MEKFQDSKTTDLCSVDTHDRARLQGHFQGTPRSFRRWFRNQDLNNSAPGISKEELANTLIPGKIWTVGPEDCDWPSSVGDLLEPPIVLYGRGTPLPSGPKLAVVGSRTEDPFTHRMCRLIIDHWATVHPNGAVISGGGLGVDQVALSMALKTGLHPVVCLAGDISRPTPRSLTSLFEQVLHHGTLLSEAFPGTPSFPYLFPDRNRLIAALSDAVVVVRAARKSGSLNTLEHALTIGRPVYGIPGPIDDPGWAGLHDAFDNQTAIPLFNMERLGTPRIRTRASTSMWSKLTKNHRILVNQLERGPATIEALSAILRLTVTDVMQMMLDLELANIVCRRRDDTYETRLESEKACQN
ncbi:MAG: hypothetical protein CMH54_07480 [Myxococcales bacterium]|nr:hypothetical protein [Myxococcales bacterium]